MELGQIEADNTAADLHTAHQPPHSQLPMEPEAEKSTSSFNLCIFSYMPKDSVTMGHIFLVKSPLSCTQHALLVPSAVCYKINAINMVGFIDRKITADM